MWRKEKEAMKEECERERRWAMSQFCFFFLKITKASVTLDNQTVVTHATHTFAESLKEPDDKNNSNLMMLLNILIIKLIPTILMLNWHS